MSKKYNTINVIVILSTSIIVLVGFVMTINIWLIKDHPNGFDFFNFDNHKWYLLTLLVLIIYNKIYKPFINSKLKYK